VKAAGLQALPHSNSPASREPGEDRQKNTTCRPVQDTTERRDRTYLAIHHASLSLSLSLSILALLGTPRAAQPLGAHTTQRSAARHSTAPRSRRKVHRSVGGRGEERAHDIRRAASLGPVPQIFACGQ
jgi:hypothetical protein